MINAHYGMTHLSLRLIKQSEAPQIDQLRLEILLIRIKRLLLNDETFASSRPEMFEELLLRAQRVCCGDTRQAALDDLEKCITRIIRALGGIHCNGRAAFRLDKIPALPLCPASRICRFSDTREARLPLPPGR